MLHEPHGSAPRAVPGWSRVIAGVKPVRPLLQLGRARPPEATSMRHQSHPPRVHSLTAVSPGSRRSLAIVPSLANEGTMARLRWGSGEAPGGLSSGSYGGGLGAGCRGLGILRRMGLVGWNLPSSTPAC